MKGYSVLLLGISVFIIMASMAFLMPGYVAPMETANWNTVPYSVGAVACSIAMDKVSLNYVDISSIPNGDVIFNVIKANDPNDQNWYLAMSEWEKIFKDIQNNIGIDVELSWVDLDPNNSNLSAASHYYKQFNGYNAQARNWGLDHFMLLQVYYKNAGITRYYWISWAVVKNNKNDAQCHVIVR